MAKRSDEVDPTLIFSEEEMEIATKMFTSGKFKRGHFEEVLKEHLMAPPSQHKLLSQNLKTERSLRGIDGGYNPVKELRDKLSNVGLDLRIAQRPYILSISVLSDLSCLLW